MAAVSTLFLLLIGGLISLEGSRAWRYGLFIADGLCGCHLIRIVALMDDHSSEGRVHRHASTSGVFHFIIPTDGLEFHPRVPDVNSSPSSLLIAVLHLPPRPPPCRSFRLLL